MIIGEDKNKIRNIVKPALVQFKDIYSLLIEEFLIPDTHNQWKLKVSTVEPRYSSCTREDRQKWLDFRVGFYYKR